MKFKKKIMLNWVFITIISILDIHESYMFMMGMSILVRQHLYIKTVPLFFSRKYRASIYSGIKEKQKPHLTPTPCHYTMVLMWLISDNSWWRHQKETFSALLALCLGNSAVADEFPSQRPVTRSFYFFSDLNEWLNNQSWGWWFEMPSR